MNYKLFLFYILWDKKNVFSYKATQSVTFKQLWCLCTTVVDNNCTNDGIVASIPFPTTDGIKCDYPIPILYGKWLHGQYSCLGYH